MISQYFTATPAALASVPRLRVSSVPGRFPSYREERVAPLLLRSSTAHLLARQPTSAMPPLLLSPLAQSARANFVLAAAKSASSFSPLRLFVRRGLLQ
jgi:hypothetical protein